MAGYSDLFNLPGGYCPNRGWLPNCSDAGRQTGSYQGREGLQQKKRNVEIALFMFIVCGAEGETRTPTREPSLDPEPSASTTSATSALLKRLI